MSIPNLYDVHDQDGNFLLKIGSFPEELESYVSAEFPGYRFRIGTKKVVVYLPRKLSPSEIAAINNIGSVDICGEPWQVVHIGGHTSSRKTKVIFVECAPSSTWSPGMPVPDATFVKWQNDVSLFVNEEMLVRLSRDTAYIFGDFKDKHVATINRVVKRFREGGINVDSPAFQKFIKQAIALKNQEFVELEKRKASVEREIENSRAKLIELHRSLVGISDLLKNEPAPVEVESIISKVQQLSKVEKIEVQDTNLVIFTTTIFIQKANHRHEIGRFKITINILDGNIKMYNLDNIIEGHHHPHIDGGAICFGEIQSAVPKLVSNFMIVELVTILIRFLENSNEDDCYLQVDNWPVKPVPAPEFD